MGEDLSLGAIIPVLTQPPQKSITAARPQDQGPPYGDWRLKRISMKRDVHSPLATAGLSPSHASTIRIRNIMEYIFVFPIGSMEVPGAFFLSKTASET
jgi:hypothetical protein